MSFSISRSTGFTLLELMVTVAVLGIMMSIAIPGFGTLIAGNRVTTLANDLHSAIQQTRMEAVRRGQRVTLCNTGNPDATTCNITASPAPSWAAGWIMFTDGGVAGTVDGTDRVIRRGGGATANGLVTLGNGAMANYVSFTASGESKTNTGAFLAGSIRVCSQSDYLTDDRRSRRIIIANGGRAIVEVESNIANTCPAP